MKIIELIEKKKKGKQHSEDEIKFLINSFVDGSASDAQMAAWLMAVSFSGLTEKETAYLTEALAYSGKVIDFEELKDAIVDKHSTGGVGDKVTITLIPLLAAAGVPIAKISDRGIGHAAGTVDKLESIPHMNTIFSIDEISHQVKEHNAIIASQDENLAPADKKLQALRNITATTDNISLIASSILSKKFASGASKIVLDVKYGSGAFMKTPEEAINLSRLMVNVGKILNKRVLAFVTSMDEPLGRAIGNSIEVIESMEFLKGHIVDGDLAELTYSIAETILVNLGLYEDRKEAGLFLKNLIDSGKAIEKCRELVIAQGGDVEIVDNYDKFELPHFKIECESKKSGYVQKINAFNIAKASKILGASRENSSDIIDYSVGIYLNKKSGEYVNKGEILYTIYSNDEDKTRVAQKLCDDAFSINENKPIHNSLIYKIIKTEYEDDDV